jgi:plasmid stability protein
MHSMNAHHLTVRNLPEDVSTALEQEKRRRGTSLNQTVIDLLRQSLGVSSTRSNGLARLAGTWTEPEHRRFLESIQIFEKIDLDWWR